MFIHLFLYWRTGDTKFGIDDCSPRLLSFIGHPSGQPGNLSHIFFRLKKCYQQKIIHKRIHFNTTNKRHIFKKKRKENK